MPLFRASPTLIALIVACAFFMENLDGAAITIVLPQIAKTFLISPSAASLGVTIYMVSLAIFLAMSGWAADRFGPRNFFCWAIAVFTLASVACGLSTHFWFFVVTRAVQGAAAAFMSPVGRVIVLRTAPKSELMRAFGITIWPGLVAPIIGQPIGGLIATYLSWKWIFFLNVPIGVAGILLLLTFVDNHRGEHSRRLDLVGLTLTALSLSAMLYGLDLISHEHPDWRLGGGLIIAGLLVGVQAVRHASGHDYPLIDVSLAEVRTFAFTTISGGTFFRIAMGAAPFLLPLLFQIGFGMTAFDSSLLMLAYGGGNLAMKAMTNPILKRFGFRRVLVVNGVVVIISVLSFAFLVPRVPLFLILASLILAGLTRSLQFTALNTLAFADIRQSAMSSASTMQTMLQQVAFAFGIALGAVILSVSAEFRAGAGASIGVPDFQVAFAVSTLMTIAALPWLVKLATDAGDEISGHSRARSSARSQAVTED